MKVLRVVCSHYNDPITSLSGPSALNDIKFGLGDIKFGLEVMNEFSDLEGSAVVASLEEMSITADALKG